MNLYVDSEADIVVKGAKVHIKQTTNYPWDGKVTLEVTADRSLTVPLSVRVPVPAFVKASGAPAKVPSWTVPENTESTFLVPTTKVAVPAPPYAFIDLPTVPAPVSSNVTDGTAGFLQWASDGADASHFVIFDRPEAIHAGMTFLKSAAFEGGPRIERVPSTHDR